LAKLPGQHEKSLPKPKVAGSTPAGTANVSGILGGAENPAVTSWLQVLA
jgi:hypothetical protein